MNIATNVELNMTVDEDGSWSSAWAWTNSGSESLPSVYEDILIEDLQGLVLDRVKEPLHSVEPGITCLGNSSGHGRARPGDNVWRLKVFSEAGEMLGEAGGRFVAMIPS